MQNRLRVWRAAARRLRATPLTFFAPKAVDFVHRLISLVSNISSTGNPLRGFPTKNIPPECFSTLLRFEEHKEFRSLRRATKGSAFGNRKPLKRLDLNFECLRENALVKAFFDKVGCFLGKLLDLLLRFALKHNSYERFCTRNSYKYSSALTKNILNAVYLLCNI